jgi:choline dehydrogenase-like flavoprotein
LTNGNGFDVVIVGGGPAGAVLANRLTENPDRSVLLIEAGPDYGPLSSSSLNSSHSNRTRGASMTPETGTSCLGPESWEGRPQ